MLLGIDLGRAHLRWVLGEPDGVIRRRCHVAVPAAAGEDWVRERLAEALAEVRQVHPLAAVGLVSSGAGAMPSAWLEEMAQASVVTGRSVDAAAWAEARFGAGSGGDPLLYVALGAGVEGCLLVSGRCFPGGVEVGQLRLDKAGTCVEDRCSGWAVDRRIREAAALHPSGALALAAEGATQGEARFLAGALAQHDPLAYAVLSEWADHMAFGLSHAVHLFRPARIVLGGGLARMGEPLRSALASALPQYLGETVGAGPEVALAALGDEAGAIGALGWAASCLSE